MNPMVVSLIASALLGQKKANDEQAAWKEQQKLEAMKQKWSPFTGQRGNATKRPNSADPMMQALLTGAMIGKQFKSGGAESNGDQMLGNVPQTSTPQNGMNSQYEDDLYGRPKTMMA